MKVLNTLLHNSQKRKVNFSWKIVNVFKLLTLLSIQEQHPCLLFDFIYTFYFYLGFLSQPLTNHHGTGRGGYFFNFSLPLPPASQTLRHQPSDYCRDLTSAHRQQLDLTREPLVSERNSLVTKLRALIYTILQFTGFNNDNNSNHGLLATSTLHGSSCSK